MCGEELVVQCVCDSGRGVSCVQGYELVGGECFLQGFCDVKDQVTGICHRCQNCYTLRNDACVLDRICTDGQYKNANGACIVGNIPNCLLYRSPSG